jgi:hypothetical protein
MAFATFSGSFLDIHGQNVADIIVEGLSRSVAIPEIIMDVPERYLHMGIVLAQNSEERSQDL